MVGLAVILAALAGVAFLIDRSQHAPQPGGGRRFANTGPMPVVAATAKKGDVDITLGALGTVTPLATVTVKTQIAGQLTKIAFSEGQTIHTGDFLAQIDPRSYQTQLDQFLGQLKRDQALLRDAKINLARYEKLLSEDSIARQQRDTQESLVNQYDGAVTSDQALVDNARLNLAYCHIVSPITGQVGLRQVDQGNYVQTNDAGGIVVITQMQPISVIFSLPEDNLPAILTRLRQGATLEVAVYDRSQVTKLATGKLLTMDNQIDSTTGTVKLRALFDNQDEALYPNQFVNARMLVDVLHEATVIPSSAIQRGTPGTFVYLIKPDNTVTVRPITLGPAAGELVSIRSGLEPGDRVVVDGADKLRDGAPVALPSTDTPAQSGTHAEPKGPRESREGQGERHHRHHGDP
ncbi:MAG: MdtA/MuxA family multidrug efflux RND transporter periplasmic adaptor subunit [Alphaproteobacteria bacterium]|nr:MdtA/MuxA family multidrug efflux RND transporter periplasmic adaptor subunit [Alphaproteobacteria bacterium]